MNWLWLNHSYTINVASFTREAILFGKENKILILIVFNSVQLISAQSCPTLCDPMDCRMPGFPVHHQLPELAQTYVHRVGEAIQTSHPLSPTSPPAFNLSQQQGLFQWVSSSHQVAKVLECQLQHVLPMNIEDWFPWGLTGLISLQFKGLSRLFSNTIVQKHQCFGAQLSLWFNSHMTAGKTMALTIWTFVGKVMALFFNMLSRLVIVFLPRSKRLLI